MLNTPPTAPTIKTHSLKFWPVVGWLLFFGIFLLFIIPKAEFFSEGFPIYIGFENNFQRAAFVVHILAGIIVYIAGIIQFTPAIRNRYISFHRKIGKLYILASLLCVFGLYILLPIFSADIFWMEVSHYANGTLWLLFVILAYLFIRRKNIKFHRRFMISSFICATYFVVIRIVDHLAMPFFRAITSDDAGAMAVSDFSVWVIPLSFVWTYWFISDIKKNFDNKNKKVKTNYLNAFITKI